MEQHLAEPNYSDFLGHLASCIALKRNRLLYAANAHRYHFIGVELLMLTLCGVECHHRHHDVSAAMGKLVESEINAQ